MKGQKEQGAKITCGKKNTGQKEHRAKITWGKKNTGQKEHGQKERRAKRTQGKKNAGQKEHRAKITLYTVFCFGIGVFSSLAIGENQSQSQTL